MSAKAETDVDRVWHVIVALVMDSRGDWRRKVAEATGLPFSRVRALRRLVDGPLTLRDLAEAMGSDAPAATLTVNHLEARGLVRREPHPEDRRAKIVTLTPEGRRLVGAAKRVTDRAPDALAALPPRDVVALRRILEQLSTSRRSSRRP
jgi:DNA-binding MarR family transcriptional regulator